jgi:hypothetical protein
VQRNITQPGSFAVTLLDLAGFSLALKHIELLCPVLQKAAIALKPGLKPKQAHRLLLVSTII